MRDFSFLSSSHSKIVIMGFLRKIQREYTIGEVAKLMGTTQKIVRRYVASGELKTTKSSNAYRISEDALRTFRQYMVEGGNVKHLEKITTPSKSSNNDTKNKDKVNWADITPYWYRTSKSKMTFVDLFCGAGGLSKGLEMAGR